jgi:ABC-type phosphate transport system permease subunit
MKPRSMKSRRWFDVAVKALSGIAALGGCFMLGWILFVLVARGAGALNWDFFTKLPTPPGVPGGGVANAIAGTLAITLLAALVGVPLGLLGGVYLAEFGRGTRLAAAIRFSANILMGVPSIIIGIFVYALLVQPMGRFSGYAGALSLAIIMLPIVVRTTEDMLAMVPGSLREAAMALGLSPWTVAVHVTAPQALRIIIPPAGSMFISMLKDSSLVSLMGLWELNFLAQSYGRSTYRYMEMLATAAAIYWIMSIVFELIQSRLERRFGQGYRR